LIVIVLIWFIVASIKDSKLRMSYRRLCYDPTLDDVLVYLHDDNVKLMLMWVNHTKMDEKVALCCEIVQSLSLRQILESFPSSTSYLILLTLVVRCKNFAKAIARTQFFWDGIIEKLKRDGDSPNNLGKESHDEAVIRRIIWPVVYFEKSETLRLLLANNILPLIVQKDPKFAKEIISVMTYKFLKSGDFDFLFKEYRKQGLTTKYRLEGLIWNYSKLKNMLPRYEEKSIMKRHEEKFHGYLVRPCACCGKEKKLKSCERCESVWVCSKKCFKKIWAEHEPFCRPLN